MLGVCHNKMYKTFTRIYCTGTTVKSKGKPSHENTLSMYSSEYLVKVYDSNDNLGRRRIWWELNR